MSFEPEKITQALEEILESEAFLRSKTASKFLSYIVTEHLEGRGNKLSEITVAQNVFNKGSDYDPRLESNVRVTAGRIRKMLRLYYSENTAKSDVIITIPKGRYTPSFSERLQTTNIQSHAPENLSKNVGSKHILQSSLPKILRNKAIIFSAALIVCLLSYLALSPSRFKINAANSSETADNASPLSLASESFSSTPEVAVALFENKTGYESYDFLETALQNKTVEDLSRYSAFNALAVSDSYEAALSDSNESYQYVMSAIILSVEPEADLLFKLYDRKKNNSVVYEKRVLRTSTGEDYFAFLSEIIAEISATARDSVTLNRLNEVENDITAGKRDIFDLEAFDCLNLFNTSLVNRDPIVYEQGYMCLQSLLKDPIKEDEATLLAYFGILTFVGDRNPIFKAHLIDPNINAERGIDMLLKSIEIEPLYATSHYFLSQAYSQLGEQSLALKHAQLGHLGNPTSNGNLTLLSQNFAANNEWDQALSLAKKAIERNPNPRGNYYRTDFAFALLNEDKENLDRISKIIKETDYYYADLFLFLAAMVNGDTETVDKLRENVVKLASNNFRAQNKETHSITHWVSLFGNQEIYAIANRLLIEGGVITEDGDVISCE